MSNRQSKRKSAGFVMLLVLGMVVLLLIIGIGLLALGSGARKQAVSTATAISARTAADAGLLDAVHLMSAKLKQKRQNNEPWDNAWLPYESSDTNLADASYCYEITGNASSGFQVASKGRSGISQKEVHGVLEVRSVWSGITVSGNIHCGTGGFVTDPPGEEFVLRTNSVDFGAVTLENGVVIPGDVVIGPDGDRDTVIILRDDSMITGQMYAALGELVFPQVVPPSGLPDKGTISIGGSEVVTINSDGQYSDLMIGDSGTVRIENDGGVGEPKPTIKIYVTGNVQLWGAGKLLVAEDTSVIMYVGGRLELRDDAEINTTVKDATKLIICGTDTCDSIVLENTCDFYGAVYARNADLRLENTGDLYGSFVGRSLTMDNTSTIYHYVTALAIVDIDDDMASRFRTKHWWE